MRLKTLSLAIMVAAGLASTTPTFAAAHSEKVTDKPLELSIHFHTKKYVYGDDWAVEKEAAKRTGVSLKNIASMATTNSQEAFNLLIASGDMPDIVGGSSMKENVNQYGPEGAFAPLNDLIEKHAPHMKKYFDENPAIKSAISAADGQMYYIPYLPDGKYGRAYFIRTDWLKKLKLETPKTVDELYEVLVAFRDLDPNGNGKKDEIPYFNRNWEEMLRLVVFFDGRTSGSDTRHDFHVHEGEVRHGYVGEGYKNGIRHIAKWYKEKLIDPEIFTRGSRSREYLLSEDLGGVTHDWFASTSGYNVSMAKKVPGFELKAMVPPASISGKQIEEHRRTPVKPEGWAITTANKNPVETIKYFDFFFSEEGRRLANFGIEGTHYDMIDGKPIFKPEVLNSDKPINAQMWSEGAQIPRGFRQDYAYEKQWSNKFALEGIALYDQGDYLIPQFLGVAFNEEEKKVFDKYWATAQNYMLEKQQAWILGSSDVDKDWDAYIAQLDRMGYPKVIEVMQSAHDRQYGKK